MGDSTLKGAKTLEEIEAEMRGPKVMSLEELERRIIGENSALSVEKEQQAALQAQLAMEEHLLKLQVPKV